MTKQPKWKLLANLGDVNPIEYGGYFVYVDETGAYDAEAERLEPPMDDVDEDDPSARWEVRRICLDRCKLVEDDDHRVYVVPVRYDASWPYPVSRYAEWFTEALASIAEFVDTTVSDLRTNLCSEEPVRRALAYQAIYDYHGWDNGDSYPLTLTRAEVEERYKD